jgi:hypothetical protein
MKNLHGDNNFQNIRSITSHLTWANHWDHLLARWGVNRGEHRVTPGLYAIGNPTPDSLVFVTANYTLSFDALRVALTDLDGFILVLDTQGINVWCAAGKGTFGTDELVRKIETTQLGEIVRHRTLILPQLGAPGIAAHEVRKRSGFKVEYGPARAADLSEYLKTHQATTEMRRVRFALRDRLVLIPVDLVHVLLPLLIAILLGSKSLISAILAGVVLFPVLLPWIPTQNFSTKGFILGLLVALPFTITALFRNPDSVWWLKVGWVLVNLLLIPSITAFIALNFTGSTTFTSRSGVRREIFAYIPVMASMFIVGIILNVSLLLIR